MEELLGAWDGKKGRTTVQRHSSTFAYLDACSGRAGRKVQMEQISLFIHTHPPLSQSSPLSSLKHVNLNLLLPA
jgi:hypothetical protein